MIKMDQNLAFGLVLAAAFAMLLLVPLHASDYTVSFLINTLCYVALATAWRIFSAPTRYFSLAVSAFFGIGAYVVAISYETLPLYGTFLLVAAAAVFLALLVGATTLRVSGIHFVIFTFGLTELIRELFIWWEINQTKTVGRYVLMDIGNNQIYVNLLVITAIVFVTGYIVERSKLGNNQIYVNLLVITAVVFVTGYIVERSKLGKALQVIGEDETVADQCGINRSKVKIAAFAISAVLMALVGAAMAPRWSYIAPNTVFNPMVSFNVLIMVMLGGMNRLWGPLLGVIPMVLLSEFLSITFPRVYAIVLGLIFLFIVYFLPHGIAGLIEDLWKKWRTRKAPASSSTAILEER